MTNHMIEGQFIDEYIFPYIRSLRFSVCGVQPYVLYTYMYTVV